MYFLLNSSQSISFNDRSSNNSQYLSFTIFAKRGSFNKSVNPNAGVSPLDFAACDSSTFCATAT